MIINPNTLFTPVVSTGLIPMVRTNIKFNSEGIDYKYSLLGISQIEEKNLNKLKQILALFHNFPSMDINKPRLNKRLYEIDRVRQLTKGIDSQEWIESNLKSCSNQAIEVYNNIIMTNGVKLFTNSHMIENEKYGVFEFSLEDEATNLIPYIVFKYIATNLNDESLNVYYELQKDKLENSHSHVSNTPISKAEQLIIKIVTSEYIFIIKAEDAYMDNCKSSN